MTLERSLLDRDLSNAEDALDAAIDGIEAKCALEGGRSGEQRYYSDTIEGMRRARRELKRFRENWERAQS